jgi:hypothetical protein
MLDDAEDSLAASLPPKDDDRPRDGANEISQLIGKTVKQTEYILGRKPRPTIPAFKFNGMWRLVPSHWYKWQEQQAFANLAEVEQRCLEEEDRAEKERRQVSRQREQQRHSRKPRARARQHAVLIEPEIGPSLSAEPLETTDK